MCCGVCISIACVLQTMAIAICLFAYSMMELRTVEMLDVLNEAGNALFI